MDRKRRGPIPAEFRDAVAAGYDYDHTNTVEENRDRATDEGRFEPEMITDEGFDAWREEGEKLSFNAAQHQWDLGDWVVRGEELKAMASTTRDQRFKHAVYSSAADITGLSIATIKDYAYVARNVPEDIRERATLGFGHHKLVAGLPRKQQLEFLSEMQLGHLTVGDARARIRFVLNQGQPKPQAEDKTDVGAERITRLCDQLLESLSRSHLTATNPAVYFALMDAVTKTCEVLEAEIAAASVRTDAGR
jgi:hypothetical protein